MKISPVSGLVLVLCSACARFTPQPISPFATLSRFESRRLDNPDLQAGIHSKNTRHGFDTRPVQQWNLDLLMLTAFYSMASFKAGQLDQGCSYVVAN